MIDPMNPMSIPGYGSHFSAGFDSGRGPQSPSLAAQSTKWTAAAQAAGMAPHSVLNQLSPSLIASNLSARSQSSRLLPNGYILPNNSNGTAQPTAETENYLQQLNGGS